MSYYFGELVAQGFSKARIWLKGGIGVYSNGKPPVDDACDNNYQNYSDSVTGTGAVPSFKALNASNQFEINCGHAVVDTALTVRSTAVPATPTAVVNGTTGATTYVYRVVGRSGSLQAPSATRTVTTGNATLSTINSITLTFVPTPGFLTYDIYRSTGGSTQGMIGTVIGIFGPNVATPTLTFTDAGLVADGSTAPTVNTTGAVVGDLPIYGNFSVNALATPATPLVTAQGTTGAVTWAYKVVALTQGVSTAPHTAASAAGSATNGVATLTATNSNLIAWQPVVGAVGYNVYRVTSGTTPSSTGLIGTTAGRTFVDTGLAGDSSTAPTTNTTGTFGTGASVSPQFTVTPNWIPVENGANNAIATSAGSGPALTTGLQVTILLAHSLQAGANTLAYNGGSAVAIKQNTNPATDLGTAYVVGGVITCLYTGSVWVEMS